MEFLSSSLLSVLIALGFIYVLLSVLVSILVEWRNHYVKERGKLLREAINQMLDDPLNAQYGLLLYNHPMIGGMQNRKNQRPPQYISSSMFAEALIDLIGQQAEDDLIIDRNKDPDLKKLAFEASDQTPTPIDDPLLRFQMGVAEMKHSPLKELLHSFHQKSKNDYPKLKSLLEEWYNAYMDRVSGWYKTKQKSKFVFFGFVVAIALNVDSLHLVKSLSSDSELRTNLEKQAMALEAKGAFAEGDYQHFLSLLNEPKDSNAAQNNQVLAAMEARLDSVGKERFKESQQILHYLEEQKVPMGWSLQSAPLSWFAFEKPKLDAKAQKALEDDYQYQRNQHPNFWTVLKYLIGVIITGYMLSFGAPFWFEVLVRLINIRRAGKKPAENTNA